MRIAIAQVWQETNTFSPFPSELQNYADYRLCYGEAVLERCAGQELGGFIAAARAARQPVELVPLLAAGAWPAGRLRDEVLRHFETELTTRLAQALPVDGVLLSLHGALAAESVDSVDTYLVSTVRRLIGPAVPIGIALDHHANVTEGLLRQVNVLSAYRSLPHIDMAETGQRAAELLFAELRGETRPVMRWRKIPMVTPADNFLTGTGPLSRWFGRARELEQQPGVLAISLFPVQPWLDVPELGWAAVVITDGQPELAQRLADELGDLAWSLRHELFLPKLPPEDAIAAAMASEGRPVVIADGSDSVNSGAPGDSTWLLKSMLGKELGGLGLVTVTDPEAVRQALQAGIGETVTLAVGGKRDHIFSTPVEVTGRVIRASDGRFTITGHLGSDINMGRTVVLACDDIRLLLSEGVGSGHDPMVYRHLGLDPALAKIVVVKTPVGFWLSYGSFMHKAILADCPGLSSSNLRRLPFRKVTRPLFPLDDLPHWQAAASVALASS
jgi:microcystin degradation protein MlrC